MNATTKSPLSHQAQQQGISLFIVLIIICLSALLTLWASKTTIFNELIIGNDADYQRAVEAAQAMLQDAELDIRGQLPDGTNCAPVTDPNVCRAEPTLLKLPASVDEMENRVRPVLEVIATTQCKDGLCLRRNGPQDFWNDNATFTAMKNAGARYGQFTGAKTGSNSNPILSGATARAWYWIEIMPYTQAMAWAGLVTSAGPNIIQINMDPPYAYRITAIAQGNKPSTQVVQQTVYIRRKLTS